MPSDLLVAQAVTCLSFDAGSTVLVTGGDDTLINVWLLPEVLDVQQAASNAASVHTW